MTTETKPGLGSPLAHLIRKEDQPAREGTVVLCGKCLKVLRRELGL